jgi:hypothetical protein
MSDAAPITADPATELVGPESIPELLTLAHKVHSTMEPLHIVVYFAPEGGELYAAAGVRGGRRQYFASRSAALGRVPAEVVAATFYNFAPPVIAKYIPSVWDTASIERVLQVRLDVVDAAMRRILGEDVLASDAMAEAAALAREAAGALGNGEGRPLYAAHASLPWPGPAHLQLWHAQTLLREHRGDGHIAALVLAGLDGIEALASYVPLGKGLPEPLLRATRGWSDEDWESARGRLRERGLLDADGAYTAAGRAQREQIEEQTDRAAIAPWALLGSERATRLREVVRPWARALSEDMFGAAG